MKFSERMKIFIGPFIVSMGIMIAGCGGMANVSLKNYEPSFTSDHSVLKGKSVYLMNFDNQAEDTEIWYYFSKDRKISYGNEDLIHNYFW